jgi:hypothetical protein
MSRQKPPNREGKHWSSQEERLLKKLAKEDTPTPLIAWELGRTTDAIYNHASKTGVSLEPPNPRHKRRH